MLQVIANRYQIIEVVGEGGMGTVYKGRDTNTEQLVAIKHLKPDLTSPELIERFKREGDALRELNHPNIVKMLDAVQENGNYYLIIEYLSGGDLNDLLKQESLAVEKVLQIAIDICDALTRAHRLNIVHRDLKPANVLIAEDGTPRLTDFGIAHIKGKQRVTASDSIIGTVDYLAPEILDGAAIDPRTDIWAFGVMLFEMLAGKRPFKGEIVSKTLLAIMTEPVPDLEALRPDVPLALIDLVYRMLEKDPQLRIPSVRYIGAELETILHGNQTHPAPSTQRFQTPQPSSTTPVRHNLPMQLTTFIGRKNELAELAQLLQKDAVRLVTITAQGGMGKSRLALESARQHLNVFTDGVYLVELAPLSEAESIVQALIDAVRCPYAPDEKRSRTQQLVEFLAEKHMLLVMDNFEHLIAGAGIVTEILSATSQVRILATSRQRLNQSNEHLVQLEPMPYPDWETPEDAMKYDAFQLFVQSARRIRPDFELTSDNLDYVTRICQGVQGLPLGIVLAATWLSLLTPQEIVTEMRQSFDFLETEMTDVPARQRSMRQVFEYSWQLMTEKERQIMMALSVFRGGFSREAAAEVCQAGLRDLMGLMNKSLINRDTASGRYSIHELLRQYAAGQLAQSGQEDSIYDAHKSYFAAWMQAREGEITYRRQQAALDDIGVDFENVRLAWECAVGQHDYASLNLMVEALHLFTEMRTRHDEGHRMLQAALNITPTTERLHYRLVFRRARLAYHGSLGDLKKYYSMIPAAQAQAAAQQDNNELGFGIFIEVITLWRRTAEAIKLLERALSLLSPDAFYRGQILSWLASLLVYERQTYQRGIALFDEALTVHRERGDVNELPWTLGNLILALNGHLKFKEAESHVEEALHYSHLIRQPHAEGFILNSAIYVALHHGEFEKVLELAEKSYNLAAQAHQIATQAWAVGLKLQVQCLLNVSTAATEAQIAKLIMERREIPVWVQERLTLSQAFLHCTNGNNDAARRMWQDRSNPTSPSEWIQIFAFEVILHIRATQDKFVAVLVGHLATYGDDVVGWLKRWSRYQEALSQLQARLDASVYKAAFAHGQTLTLDEMVQELKTNTGMV